MPSFFQFTQGNESGTRLTSDASPLLGRFRAVPQQSDVSGRRRRSSTLGLFAANNRGSVHVGYGALLSASGLEGYDNDGTRSDWEDLSAWERTWRKISDVWVEPKQSAVKGVVDVWWSRYGVLVLMPAALAIAWCAIPFPTYSFPGEDDDDRGDLGPGPGRKIPGHGEARVQINFWFFLFVYYGFYNVTALIWITKVFNLYSLNWWPQSLGFPITMSLIALVSIAVPIPIYLSPETRFLTVHNTAWISWTFIVMAMPVTTAFCILLTSQRHLKLRQSLSETQRIFTSSWWTGEAEGSIPRRDNRRRPNLSSDSFDPDSTLQVAAEQSRHMGGVRMRRRWLPASFVRFIWFCLALFVGLMAYVIGEAYAEIYLRTLPHNNLETIVYVYSWIITVHLLDALTGWLLGIREGERVGSYPLSWVFKLYFMLTYQTYVRALYARLRSPEQFIYLQILSSSTLIILTPLTMSRLYHRITVALNLTDQSYASYQKVCTRNVFIRFLAENVSMAAFLGSILVLHFGPNKDVYPYFAFDMKEKGDDYDFNLTFRASFVTWACELVASVCVRALIRWIFGVDVGMEGKLDLAVWPELLPTSVAVMFHVLQNMFFSIIRLQFH
ncbi:conserved fungal protein [Colletotrichum tofieldiae]|uniref:Conserved fungal protein n=1 Tax=Colletotrichum tofieldiae TaxID=708197 RepID=A0A166RSR5_9PEZI|nr:conserved fungal protein [Colletotrichum tofieldiae]GKT64582.1 conserved fungal protein [Colletotrichum tofieldiae]